MIELDYGNLEQEIESGRLRARLRQQLAEGFRDIHEKGERLPPPSYYAARIAEILNEASGEAISQPAAFDLYQEVLLACQEARSDVLGEEEEQPN
ncbi:MAG: hypothetical protein WBX15_09040 [Thermoanaerobaculia bacterium]